MQGLIVVLCLLVNVLVEQRSPVHDEQSVGIVVRPGHSLQLTCRDEFTGKDIAASLDALTAIVP